MPDGHVSATEANRSFSKMLRDVEGGAPDGDHRRKARERMMALLRDGLPLGFGGGVDRDGLHSR